MTTRSPVRVIGGTDIDRAASFAARLPSDAQKAAGNYPMGHFRLANWPRMDFTIENAAGSPRTGKKPNGQRWSVTMAAHYGYARGTEGADGDAVDVYFGPNPESDKVWVIDQYFAGTNDFDEHKCMLGWYHEADALNIYDLCHDDGRGPERRRAVTEMSKPEFMAWLNSGDTKKPLAPLEKLFDPSQPRDNDGRFAGGGRGAQASHSAITPQLPKKSAKPSKFLQRVQTLAIQEVMEDALDLALRVGIPALLHKRVGKRDPAFRRKFRKVMREWKSGALRSGHGGVVDDQKQAIAIAYSQAQKLGKQAAVALANNVLTAEHRARQANAAVISASLQTIRTKFDALQITPPELAKASRPKKPAKAAADVEDQLGENIAAVLSGLDGETAARIAAQVSLNSPEAAAAALPVQQFQDQLANALSPLDEAFHAGVQSVPPPEPPTQDPGDPAPQDPGPVIAVDLRARNQAVQDYLDGYKMDLIRQITTKQQDAIKQVITDASTEGQPPAVIARRIRDTIGLTANQAANVVNYRQELEDLDPASMGRALRDRRYDRTIQKAIRTGNDLTPAQIDDMVGAYRSRYIAYRAMTIARTESLRAANQGIVASMQAAIDSGDVNPADVVKVWIATEDARTRPDHVFLDHKEVQGMDTPFDLPDGSTIQFPHDPDADASEVVNCRCTLAFRVEPEGAKP